MRFPDAVGIWKRSDLRAAVWHWRYMLLPYRTREYFPAEGRISDVSEWNRPDILRRGLSDRERAAREAGWGDLYAAEAEFRNVIEEEKSA